MGLLPDFDFIRNNEYADADEKRRALIVNVGKTVLLFMALVALLILIVSAVTGSSIKVPNSPEEVLGSIENEDFYSWEVESIRIVGRDNKAEQRYDAVRSTALDSSLNKFQVSTIGTLPDQRVIVSDGKLTASLSKSDQNINASWQMLNDYCSSKPAINVKTVEMPSPADILAASPSMHNVSGTVYGTRAWIINFRMNPTILTKLLGLDFFNAFAPPDSLDGRFVLSAKERSAVKAGKFKVDYARVWVSNNRARQIRQIDVRFKFDVPGGSKWRIFARRDPNRFKTSPMQKVSFGKADCSANRVGSATVEQFNDLPEPDSGTGATSSTGETSSVIVGE